jgi:fructose-specific phosphotransferase system IIC component
MVSILVSKAVDCGFISGVMVSVLISKAVDHGFISGIMVSVLNSLKQQSASRHVAPFGHIILIPDQPVFALSP